MIDDGKCEHITKDHLEEISIIVHEPEYLCTEKAIKYMRVSRNVFFEYVRTGVIDKPIKPVGLSNKLYLKSGLDKAIKKMRKKQK
jgi:hypothetical protein